MRDCESDAERFDRLFDELGRRVYDYVRRQCDAATAQDIVSDTFLLAWEKRAVVPDDPLPWLLVVARNKINNLGRRTVRQHRLTRTVARLDQLAGPAMGADESVIERVGLLTALGRLSDADREVLLLVAWDGLTGTAAAAVLGCTTRAFEMRLSRARARLERQLSDDPEPARPHVPVLGEVH